MARAMRWWENVGYSSQQPRRAGHGEHFRKGVLCILEDLGAAIF